MQLGSTTRRVPAPDDDPPSGLDVHAAAALDRLTRWAAKALRATVAVIRLEEGAGSVTASVTDAEAALASARMREFAARIVATSRPCAINDARPDACEHDHDDAVAVLGAPLLDRDGIAVGSFCVMHTSPRCWTIQDVELVNELTSSAMTELQLRAARAEAEREKRWSDRQQAVLELIAARAPLAKTLSELLGAAETHAPGMLAAITRLDHVRGGGDRLRVVARIGLPRSFTQALDGVTVGENSSISGRAAHSREPALVTDIAAAALSPWFVELASGNGLRAGWSTPILARNGGVLGTFTIYYRAARTPDGLDRVVINRSVHLARLALEQVDDTEALRRSVTRAQSLAREQTALQRVATRVADATEPETLFSHVAEQVGRLLKAQAGYVLRFEDVDAYRNMGSWARDDDDPLLAPGAVATHLPDGACALLRTVRSARRCAVDPGRDALNLRHRIIAPVIVDGRSWGIVVALRDRGGFRREDEKRVVRFAQLASVAVANAHAHEALATQARTDSLTGLANRRAFDERLAEETERAHRHRRALSVMLVDVDRFKTINDRFGHAAGDGVLVNLADSLRAVMRGGDLLARIGGDEMAMILPDCSAEQAARVAQRMLDGLNGGSSLAHRHGVTLSTGVAGVGAEQTADDLLRCADQALYVAKDEGRNRVVSFDDDVPHRSEMRLSA